MRLFFFNNIYSYHIKNSIIIYFNKKKFDHIPSYIY